MSMIFNTNGRIIADSISASDQPQIIMTPYTRSSTQYYNLQANSFLMNSSTSKVLFQPNYKIQTNGLTSVGVSNTRILGKRGVNSIFSYSTSVVNSWPWDGTNDTWSTTLTSITPGEIIYFDCNIDDVTSRIFVMAVSLSGSTLTAMNLGAYTITGTVVKAITGYTNSYDANYFGITIDRLFEHNLSSGDLPTTTLNFGGFNGTYVSRIYGDNPNAYGYYQYNGSILDASLRGTGPSKRLLYSSGTAGTYTISRTDQGICVNGTYYHDTDSRSRGTYPYLRVGLVLAGAGGGGSSGARSSASDYRATLYGNGGGGGGVVCYVLDLLNFPTYTITLGSGGAGGSQTTRATRNSGSDGGGSSLYCGNTTSNTYLVFTATGGKGGTNSGAGAGGGISPGTYVQTAGTLKASANGGAGGTGYYSWSDSESSETVNATAAGSCSGTAYLTALSGTTNNSSKVTWSGAAGTFNTVYSGPGGGSIGAGGAGVYQSGSGNTGSAGSGGSGGAAVMNSLGFPGGAGGAGYFYLYY